MASLKQIRRRISGVTSTRQITRAMKMVAAAKMRRAQENMARARSYSWKLQEVISSLAAHTDPDKHPLLAHREAQRIGVVCVSSDRGMAGSFNSNICRTTQKFLEDHADLDVELITMGRKAYDFFRKRGVTIYRNFRGVFQDLNHSQASAIGSTLIDQYINGKFDRYIFVYNEFKNAMQQNLIEEQLLPVKAHEIMSTWQTIDFIFEPDTSSVLGNLLPLYITNRVWHVLLESYASEQAARMTAMDTATENADELIESLTLQFNKVRQATITKELLEIVGGAEGLK